MKAFECGCEVEPDPELARYSYVRRLCQAHAAKLLGPERSYNFPVTQSLETGQTAGLPDSAFELKPT